ncbi:MAG: hypothetical protein V4707_11235 [Pseudomonadota bacterium]
MSEDTFRGNDAYGRPVHCEAKVRVLVKTYAKWASTNSIRNIPDKSEGIVDRRKAEHDGEIRVTVNLPQGLAQGIYKTHQVEVLGA